MIFAGGSCDVPEVDRILLVEKEALSEAQCAGLTGLTCHDADETDNLKKCFKYICKH